MLSPLLDFLNNLKNPPLKLDFSNRDPAASKYSILFSVTLSFLNAVSLLEKPGLYPIKCSIIWIYPSASSWHFTFSFVPCLSYEFSSVQPISCVQLFVTSWTARQASLSITNFWSPPKPMCMELMMPSSHLILCRPLLLLPSIFPASGSFQMSHLFTSGGQSIGISASASVLPMNTQDWFPLGWTGCISLQSKGLSRVFSNPQFKNIKSSMLSFRYSPTLTSIHDHWKNHSLD